MIDFPFEDSELREDYTPLPKEEVAQLSRSVEEIKNMRGIGAQEYSVVTCEFLKSQDGEEACYEWFHAMITTQATCKHFGLMYDEELLKKDARKRKVFNVALPMNKYGVYWHLVREMQE